MSSPTIAAVGVSNPPIDDLLSKTDSKYQLVLYAARSEEHTSELQSH